MSRTVWIPVLLVVIAAGVLGWFLLATDDQTQPSETPLELAEAWFDAFETGDVSRYQGLIDSDAWWSCQGCIPQVHNGPYFGGRHGVDLTESRDSRLTYAANGTIEAACAAEGTVVTCEVEWTDVFRVLAGLDPYRYNYMFTVEGGSIVELAFAPLQPNNRYQTGSQIAAYSLWLEENHPLDHDNLFFNSTMIVEPPDKAGRHRQLVIEWQSTR